jgi:alpha-N-arabinofuranosidase
MKEITLTIHAQKPIATINKNLYGHFAEHLGRCIYEGLWVGPESPIPNVHGIRLDVLEALKKLHIPVLRWPGGCFADDYHWQDGIGPRERRPTRFNRWWNSLESNHFGTHEFLELCNLLGCEPYICGNVGSGTVKEMSDWLEYLNAPSTPHPSSWSKLRAQNGHPEPYHVHYWGVGNENWGCGGNMSPQYYANEYRKYSTYLSSYSDTPLFQIACGPNAFDFGWTDKFLAGISGKACQCGSVLHKLSAISLHYYCGTAGTATKYNETEWYTLLMKALAIEELIVEHRAIMDKYDPGRRIGLICDEWGTWHPVEEGTEKQWLFQQNTMRDAIVAALSLNVFNQHADKIIMANIAQLVNVLQAMILTDGKRMCVTPTYHVFEMYIPHQNATALTLENDTDDISALGIPRIHASCSEKGGIITLTLANTHISESSLVHVKWKQESKETLLQPISIRLLSGDNIHAYNDFGHPNRVQIQEIQNPSVHLEIPAASVVAITFTKPE